MKILHNPRCSKSRQTLALIEDKGAQVEIVKYLEDVPTKAELQDVLNKLGMQASEILRKKEAIFKENFKGKTLTEEEWLDILVQHPRLIERPIVIKGDRAVIGRPPENVLELLK